MRLSKLFIAGIVSALAFSGVRVVFESEAPGVLIGCGIMSVSAPFIAYGAWEARALAMWVGAAAMIAGMALIMSDAWRGILPG